MFKSERRKVVFNIQILLKSKVVPHLLESESVLEYFQVALQSVTANTFGLRRRGGNLKLDAVNVTWILTLPMVTEIFSEQPDILVQAQVRDGTKLQAGLDSWKEAIERVVDLFRRTEPEVFPPELTIGIYPDYVRK